MSTPKQAKGAGICTLLAVVFALLSNCGLLAQEILPLGPVPISKADYVAHDGLILSRGGKLQSRPKMQHLRGTPNPCQEFAAGALLNDFEELAPCAEVCGTPLQAGEFEVWGNEAYYINDLVGGAEYTFEFCSGYSPSTWGAPALLTVAEWDGTVAFGLIATASGCSITFSPDFDTAVIIYVSVEGDCGGAWYEQQDNGIPTISCTGGGTNPAAPCPEDCTTWVIDSYTLSQTVDQILSGAPDPLCGADGTIFSSQFFTDPGTNEPWEVYPTEAYTLPLVEGNSYNINACTGPNTGTWPVEIVVVTPSGVVEATSLAAAPDCSVDFTATETGNYRIYVSEQGQCGLITDNWEVPNGYFMVQLVSAADCGEICGNDICEETETYCNCSDCSCYESGAIAQFVDWEPSIANFVGSPTAVMFCEDDGFLTDIPQNPNPSFIYVGFTVAGPVGNCVPSFTAFASEGVIYTTSIPPDPVISGIIGSNQLYWLKVFQSDIDASGGQTSINLNGANGDCVFDLQIDWGDYGNVATLVQDICPPFDDSCEADAGTISGAPFVCFGDEYTITGPSNPIYSNDASNPGIVYGVFSGSGPSPAYAFDVLSDPNFTGNTVGSSNTGALTWTNFSAFNSVWIAPITAEDYATEFYGDCHSVGPAIQVGYLNTLNISSMTVNDCELSATFSGGQPEADNSLYTWEVLDDSGNALSPPLTGTIENPGETLNLSLPGSNSYTLSVSDDAGCSAEQSFVTNTCVVFTCPILFTAVDTEWDLCPGDDPHDLDPIDDLGGFYTDPYNQEDGLEWYTDNTYSTIASADDYSHSGGDNCAVETTILYVGVKCKIGPTVGLGQVNFSLYPDYDATLLNISNDECMVPAVTSNCAAYDITPVSVPTSVPAGTSGTAVWSVAYSSPSSECFNTNVEVNYTCAGCPVINVTNAPPANACNGDSFTANLTVTPPTAVIGTDYTLQWLANGQPIAGETSLSYSGTVTASGCSPSNIQYAVSFTCINPGAPVQEISIGTTQVFPDYDSSFMVPSSASCAIPSLVSNCNNYLINPVSVPETVSPGESGTATWNVSYSLGGNCFEIEYPIAYSCANAICPVVQTINTSQEICEGAAPDFGTAESLITYDDPDDLITGINWYLDSGLNTAINTQSYTASYNGNGCNPSSLNLFAGVLCSEDPNPIFGGSLSLSVYPGYDIQQLQFSSENCIVPTLTSNCSNYQIVPVSVPTSLSNGDSGTASWAITPSAGPACFNEVYNGDYACVQAAACPSIIFISPETNACDGDLISLLGSVDDPGGALSSVEWTLLGSSTILSANNNLNLNIDNIGCGGETSIYEFTIFCNNGTSSSQTVQVNAYPEPSASLFVSGCSIDASPDCPEFSINGNPAGQSITEQTSIPGNTSTVTFNIENLQAPSALSCSSANSSANYNCGELVCPSIVDITDDLSLCSGQSQLLTLSLFDPDDQINYIEWVDLADGSVLGNLTSLEVSELVTECDPLVKTYQCSVFCFDATFSSAEVQVTYYPIPSATVSVLPGGCSIEAIPACPIFGINGGAAGETFTSTTSVPGDQSAVSISVSIPEAPTSLSCASSTETASYNCSSISCPTIQSLSTDQFICSGSTTSLQVQVNDPSGQLAEIRWQDMAGNVLATGADFSFTDTNSNCDTKESVIQVIVECQNGAEQIQELSVFIYPNPEADISLSPDGCTITASSACDNFTIDGLPSPVSYNTTISGDVSAVDFEVVNTAAGVPAACSSTSISENYNCVISSVTCPGFSTELTGPNVLCTGASTNLSIAVTDPESIGYSLTWYKDAQGSITNLGTGTSINASHSNTGCDLETVSFYVVLEANDVTNCPNQTQSNAIEIDVLPILQLSSEGSCATGYTFTANPACNLNAYTVTASPAGIPAQTSDGSVTVSLSYDALPSCGSISEAFDYNCNVSTSCPQILEISQDQSICSGETVNLQASIEDPEGTLQSQEWFDANGNLIASAASVPVTQSNAGCAADSFQYEYRLTCTDGSSISETVWISVYPNPIAEVEIGNCLISASPACPQYQINGLPAGEIATITSTEEGNNIEAIFSIVNPDAPAAISCSDTTVNLSFNCEFEPGNCPSVLGIMGPEHLCELEPATLVASLADPGGNLVSAEWTSSTGDFLAFGTELIIQEAVNACAPEVKTYLFKATCTDGTSSTASKTVFIYPDPIGSVSYSTDGCSATYNPGCPSFTVNGETAGESVSISNNPDLPEQSFSIANADAIAAGLSCSSMQEPVNFFGCQSSCVAGFVSAEALCINFQEFSVNVAVTGGSASYYTVSDGHGNSQFADSSNGLQVTFGPYSSGTELTFSAINGDDSSCFSLSESVSIDCDNNTGCIPPIVDFVADCAANGQYNVTATVLNPVPGESYVYDDQMGGQALLDASNNYSATLGAFADLSCMNLLVWNNNAEPMYCMSSSGELSLDCGPLTATFVESYRDCQGDNFDDYSSIILIVHNGVAPYTFTSAQWGTVSIEESTFTFDAPQFYLLFDATISDASGWSYTGPFEFSSCEKVGTVVTDFEVMVTGPETTLTWRAETAQKDAQLVILESSNAHQYRQIERMDFSTGMKEYKLRIPAINNAQYAIAYRDASGQFHPLKTGQQAIQKTALSDLSISPIPVLDNMQVELQAATEQWVNYQIRNVLGQILMEGKQQLKAGINNFELKSDQLPGGTYLLNIQSKQESLSKKFVR